MAHDEDIVVTRLTSDMVAECLDGMIVLDAAIRAELGPTYSEEEWGAEQFQREMPGKFQHSLVILGTEEVIAYLIASRPQPDMLHIHRLAVAASTRDQGVATCLMDTLVERALRDGVTLIRLKVQPANRAAKAFYEKLGFTRMEVPRGDSEDSHDHLLLTLGKGRRG
jgi:ribosomal protein S18 acetylase RimI-like enzyme